MLICEKNIKYVCESDGRVTVTTVNSKDQKLQHHLQQQHLRIKLLFNAIMRMMFKHWLYNRRLHMEREQFKIFRRGKSVS